LENGTTPRGLALRIAAALALVALAGCKSASEQNAEGDRFAHQGNYDQALECYRSVLNRDDLNDNDKNAALRGRGEAYLAKNDLPNAEAAFKGLPNQSSARAVFLGHIAYLRRDTQAAEKLYRSAYARGERGLVTTRLAEIVGGEAQTQAQLVEAAKILREGGGDANVAAALESAASVWNASDQGTGTPATLMTKLDQAKTAAPTYVSLELIRALLLARSGQADKATPVYLAINNFQPKPSAAYLQFIREQQASAAVSSGNASQIDQLADAGVMPVEQAAKVRAEIARALEASGGFVEALEQWRKTAGAGGAPAGRAWCEVARLEAIRGRSSEAQDAWQKAATASAASPDALASALVAIAQARGQDPLGARKALEAAAGDGSLDAAPRDDAARLLRAAERLAAALDDAAAGSATRARTLAHGALALAPDMALAVALEGALALLEKSDVAGYAAALSAASATGETRDALTDARVGRLLRAGLTDDALRAADKDPSGTLAAIGRRAPSVLALFIADGRVEDAVVFVEKLKAAGLSGRAGELLGRLRGDAAFAALWSWKRFVDAAGPADPLARKAPYCAELTLANGTSLGVVQVVSAGPAGLVARVPGRAAPLRVPPDKLALESLHGVPDALFERTERAAHELGASAGGAAGGRDASHAEGGGE
jgi:hypothetical protein